ncbi:MAG: response regulator transcription factor [Verrucomicrobiae bacterium]|nr:response regulator transcription factor [Verrucomicrobiae bacterium]MCP5532860.1 response regulator transcription factor [Akkermansiaceae bacterium]MCP5548801.1 response regulator transcription factor [Akkermansiaceae bacterium]
MKILVVEDDAKIADAIRKGLSAEGYDVSVARTGDEGWRKLSTEAFALVVLDWMLPGRDGIELLTDLGGLERRPPVLLLTARDAVEDRVMGLDHGADDYMVKPFAFVELLARMRALLRRSGAPDIVQQRVGSITADIRSRRVWRRDEEITLTPREFDLLAYLMRHPGQAVSREMHAREVWRETKRSTPLDNVIDVHVARLRRKIDDGGAERLIHTVRGVGFLFGDPTTARKHPGGGS